MGETGINTSSYIENTSFPTNQERSIKDNASLNASSFSNQSPAVNLDSPMLRIPMIDESKNILLYDINNSTSSTTRERNTDDSTFHNDIIQSRLKGLPDGWVSEIRYTGLGNSRFKVYIDPKSGYEFRSLKDAQRYILTKDISNCVVKPKKRKSFEPQTEGRELHSQHGDWLPPGWVVNTRTQNGGKCHGIKKKSYYNPSTGLRFYSKAKLFQHLDAQKLLISAIRETSSVKTTYFNNASSPTNHQQSQINNSFNILTEVSSKSLLNAWRTEIANSQKGAPEYQVPSSIRSEREDCGPSRCHFSDNCPNLDVNIMANMRESVRSSSLPSQGIVVDNSSCASLYLNCLVGENSEEIRLVNELSPACLVGASSIQATDLGEEWPFNLETEDLSQFVSSMAYDTVNEPQKTMQQFSELDTDECLFKIPFQMSQVHMTAPELTPSPSLRRQDEDLSALYGNLAIEGNFEMSGEVSQPIKHTHDLGSTTSMVVEAIRKQYQASRQAATMQQFSELVTDECLFKIPVQMPQVHMTAPELTPSPSLRRQDEDLLALYGNLAIEGNFEMSGEVSQPIKHTHELGSTTSMGVEAIRKQYQASRQAATMQQFSELVTDECLFKIPVQMSQVHMTAPELTPSPSLRRQDEDLSALYGNLAIEGNFEMSGEVSQPIKHTHELGSTTSMVVEAIRKQYQASRQAAALKCYQMMHSGGEEQFDEAKANAFCQLQAETASILNQPARSNLATGRFYQQEGAPFVGLVLPYEHSSMQVSTEPTAEQEKGDAILDQQAQPNLFTGSFYRQDEAAPFGEPALTCELQRNTQSHQEFSSEQAQLGRSDSDKQKSPDAFAFGNSWLDPYLNIFTRDAPDFEDTDKVVQYFEN